MKKLNLKTVYVDTKSLKFCEYNPRIFSDKAISDLKKSIKKSGFVSPILANSNSKRYMIVIGGNLRLYVARKLGIKKVPVNYINVENIEDEKRLNLALNRVSGEWNYEALKNFKIKTLLDIGFDEKDLSLIWNDVLSIENDDFDEAKEVEAIKIPKTKLGDLYELGIHRLICGNSENPEVIKRLVGKEKVSMINCDPIYNITYDYSKGLGKKDKYHAEVKDTRSIEEYKKLLKTTIENGLAVSKDDVHCFYFCDQRYIGLLQSIYSELGLDNKRVCLWIKNNMNPTPQVAFSKCYEAVVYSTRGNPYLASINNLNEILNKEIGTGNRTIDDILDLLDIWLVKRLPTSQYEHPTSKPPSLYEKALRRCTRLNDIVLDMFAGGGSQMSACEQLKRKCYMVELEPRFCDVIIKRYETLTGNKAKLIRKGDSNENK